MEDGYLARTQALIGKTGTDRLKNCSIAVIGLGGVGSYAVEAVARCGVGHITIVDPDRIEKSNLNRQLPALNSTIGHYKTEIIAKRLLDINPALQIDKFTCAYNSENCADILYKKHNYVIDAIDSLPDKVHLIKSCLQKKIPIISSMGTANRINPLMLHLADIKDTTVCPMARKLRKELRKENINEGITVVYSSEVPLKPQTGGEDRLGSLPFVPASAGLLLASHAINSILGLNRK